MPGKIPRARRPVIRSLAPKNAESYERSDERMENKRFYASTRWRRLRALLLLDEPLCRDCRRMGRLTAAVEVHHVERRRDRPDLAFDPENLICLCKACHSRRTRAGQ